MRASEVARVALCPASLLEARKYPPTPDSDAARRGRAMHAVIIARVTGRDAPSVDLTQSDLGEAEQVAQRVAALASEYGVRVWRAADDHRLHVSMSPQIADDDGLEGQPDLVGTARTAAHVLDIKTGWGRLEPAHRNAQMRAYAVLWAATHPSRGHVYTHVVTPRGITSSSYARRDLTAARREIERIRAYAIEHPDHYEPSAIACQYCPALERCDAAARSVTGAASHRAPRDAAELAELLGRVDLARRMWDRLADEARRRMAAGETVPGWRLGRPRAMIDLDVQRTTEWAREHGIDIMPAVSLHVSRVRDLLRGVVDDPDATLREAGCIAREHTSDAPLERDR
mgnify:CR=1 FL=1